MPNNTTQDANRYTDGKLCRDASGYMVMQWTAFQGWVNTWTFIEGDGSEAPEIFATVEDAQAAIDEHLRGCGPRGRLANVILTAAILMAIFGSWRRMRRSPHPYQVSRHHR